MGLVMKKFFNVLFFGIFLVNSWAQTGTLFTVTQSGPSLPVPVEITLCLNIVGNKPVSCQNYNIQNSIIEIITNVPSYTYTTAGIKVNTQGYTYTPGVNNSLGYIPLGNISDTQSITGEIVAAPSPMIAVGLYYNTLPIFFKNKSKAKWKNSSTSESIGEFNFNSSSCAGNLCTAAGFDYYTGLPLLYQSTDGGATWSEVPTATNRGKFYSTSCSGSGSSAICIAGGIASGQPLLYQSINGGATWSKVVTTNNTGYYN